ncbi:uncharacterized protein LOC127805041 isoform X3 [Diospyros lotus]|uniref:uncharacterized protein LOC127805041 isoform X2 n=1 Tax=Diospyros lotus TaxID=55363 RepID=UPI002258DD06|nr:uncharacterized protein LOC127805041 isoform X2 [Diospyros lotus]XP_052198174.1 uncharacterized protein LOC127805041 isoform X3 [Diospyros lotus]
MPTFTAIALDRLIEPGTSKSMMTKKNISDSRLPRRNDMPSTNTDEGINTSNSKLERRNSTSTTTIDKKHHWTQITPALYATPESTPLPDSPSSFPPSPYIINHKRRGPRLLKRFSEDDVGARKKALEENKGNENANTAEKEAADLVKDISPAVTSPVEVDHVNAIGNGEVGSSNLSRSFATQNALTVQTSPIEAVEFSLEGGAELEDFLEPQESMSAKSHIEAESNGGLDMSLCQSTPVAEFFDAWEELSSDSGFQLPPHDVNAELREIRLNLLMEIEKRKKAEEVLHNMQNQWLRIRQQLSLVGLTLPADPAATDEQPSMDPAEELCRQLHIVRFVSNSIGRGIAKAEAEMEMEALMESKNFEIARLWDRLHYYEVVNREMSQRNQEAIGDLLDTNSWLFPV